LVFFSARFVLYLYESIWFRIVFALTCPELFSTCPVEAFENDAGEGNFLSCP
jgi:hypothetical protein